MAFCIYCGARIEEGSRFCIQCGRPVYDEAQSSPVQDFLASEVAGEMELGGWDAEEDETNK